jgi:hypothetical protein
MFVAKKLGCDTTRGIYINVRAGGAQVPSFWVTPAIYVDDRANH